MAEGPYPLEGQDSVYPYTFRCRATIGGVFLSWPLVRTTVTERAIVLDVPGLGGFLRRLGMNLPIEIPFTNIAGVHETWDRAYLFQISGEQELRELRVDQRIAVWAFSRDRSQLKARLEAAEIDVIGRRERHARQ